MGDEGDERQAMEGAKLRVLIRTKEGQDTLVGSDGHEMLMSGLLILLQSPR